MTVEKKIRGANPYPFLSTIGKDGHLLSFPKRRTIFAQRDASDGLFFVQQGNVRLGFESEDGKKATLAILSKDDFFGEGGHESGAKIGGHLC